MDKKRAIIRYDINEEDGDVDMSKQEALRDLYAARFDCAKELKQKNKMWKVLCEHFLQRFIPIDASVLDIGAGYCEFINNIVAKEKYAVDLNPDTSKYARADVTVFNEPVKNIKRELKCKGINICFMSNFLEHMDSKEDISDLFADVKEILTTPTGGVFLSFNLI